MLHRAIYGVRYTGIKSRTNRALGLNCLSKHVLLLLKLDMLMWWFGY